MNNASPNVIALLPMKGHSERVPNKNMRSFCGQPLFHRIAGALERSPFVESIVIDTDSAIIARDAALHFKKARIVKRPNELCGDAVPMNAIIAHDISLCRGEHFIQTHSTNPLLRSDTLNACIEAYFSALSRTDSLFSVTRIQSRLYWESGAAINHDPRELLRTQDLPPVFAENSNVYVFSRTSFVAAGNRRIGLKPSMFPLNRLEAIDIDDEEDFLLAEAMQALAQGNRQEPHDKPEK